MLESIKNSTKTTLKIFLLLFYWPQPTGSSHWTSTNGSPSNKTDFTTLVLTNQFTNTFEPPIEMNYPNVTFQTRIGSVSHQNFHNFDISLPSSNMQRSALKKAYLPITLCRITFLCYSAEYCNFSLFLKQSIFYLNFLLLASSSGIQKILLFIQNKT